MKLFVYGSAALALHCYFLGIARADIWSCATAGRAAVLTNTPTESETTTCKRLSLSGASYTTLPFEQMFPAREEVVRRVAPEPKQRRARLKAEPPVVRTSFKAKEVRDSSLFSVRCEVSGTAYAQATTAAELVITRGAVTVDRRELVVSGDGESTPWRFELKGSCQRAEVDIVQK